MAAYGTYTAVFSVEFMENLSQGLSDPAAMHGYSNTKYPTKSESETQVQRSTRGACKVQKGKVWTKDSVRPAEVGRSEQGKQTQTRRRQRNPKTINMEAKS